MDQQATQDRSLAELARRFSLQTTELARHEAELAKAELRVKGKRAGILALRGKSKVQQAAPPVPEQIVQSVKEDVRYTKQRAQEARQ